MKDGGKKLFRSESEANNTQTNKVGKQWNWHRESQRDVGCNTEQVWKCSICALRPALLDTRNCRLLPRLPALLSIVHCVQVERTA